MDVVSQSKSFARGVETGLVQEPLDAVRQIAYHAGIATPPTTDSSHAAKPPAEAEAPSGIAFMAGKTVGKVAEFWLINRAVGAVSGIGNINALSTAGSEALKMGVSGAVSGALTPVNDKNFAREKFAGIASEGAAFATFGGITGKASEIALLGRPGFRKFWQDAAINGTAGALSGAVGADANSILTTGNLASFDTIGKTMLQNAVMGVGFSALDHSLPRTPVRIKGDADGIKGSAKTTEDWVTNVYESSHGELRSPILTWLANKNLVPKPPNYEELRKSAWQEKNPVDLSLADWSPHQRPTVIEALRRTAHPDLGKDVNIDAFISKVTTSDTTAKIAAFREFEAPRIAANKELRQLMDAHPAFKNVSEFQLKFDENLQPQLNLPENAALKESLQKYFRLPRGASSSGAVSDVNNEFLNKLNGVAREIGIPDLKSVSVSASNSSSRIGDELQLGIGKVPGLNAVSIDNIYHEFTHHTQGTLSGKETFTYLAKYPFLKVAKQVGLIDEIPMMQSPKTTQEYINKYVGSDHEKEAWATGLLVRIRAVAAGMHNLQS